MEVSRGGWPSVGQGLGDLDLLCPGISRGRRGEQSTLLLQSRGVLGTATSASSAGLTPQRKGSHHCSLGDSLHRASLSLWGLAWDMQCKRHSCASISGAQAPPPGPCLGTAPRERAQKQCWPVFLGGLEVELALVCAGRDSFLSQ